MDLRIFQVREILKPYVKIICSMDTVPGEHMHAFRVLPDTCVELFVNYTEPAQQVSTLNSIRASSQSFIISRMSRFMDVEANGSAGCIAVCFFPGQAGRFFSIPMKNVANEITDLRYLWPFAAELEERVVLAKNNQQRVELIQDFLVELLPRAREADYAVAFCMKEVYHRHGIISVKDLAKKSGFSERQLARRFNQELGLSPKEFIRIARFICSLRRLKEYSGKLTGLAYEAGYFDQAHFIHDCRSFSGLSPRSLLTAGNILF